MKGSKRGFSLIDLVALAVVVSLVASVGIPSLFRAQELSRRMVCAANLKGIVSQQLIPRADGKGRVAAVEVLVNTERVAARIADPDLLDEIVEDIAEGDFFGMRSYDQAIFKLYENGDISFEAATSHAASVKEFKAAAQGRRLERVAN